MSHIQKSLSGIVAVAALGLCAIPSSTSAAIYSVSIDTTSLVPDSADTPFSLQLELIGGGTPGVTNTATFGDFSFAAGSAGNATSIFKTGDVSSAANFSGSVMLDSNNGAASVFAQDFSAGNAITFTIDTTANLVDATSGPFSPDGLSIQILDGGLNAVPTLDPDGTGSLVAFTYGNPSLTTATYGSDSTRPTTGGVFLAIPRPVLTTAVPEPVGTALLAFAVPIAIRRRSRLGL